MRTAVLAACIGAAGAGLMWATAPPAQGQTRPQAPVHATMNQIMRGIFFTHSNVIFAVQTQDPASIPADREGSRSTNPLTGLFGNWEAVENSSLVLAEAATLLNMPGRLCGNGRQVPVSDEEWAKFAEELRHAAINIRPTTVFESAVSPVIRRTLAR